MLPLSLFWPKAEEIPASALAAPPVHLTLNGRHLQLPAGSSVAAALLIHRIHEGNGAEEREQRAPFCGMGICQECRVTIDGQRLLACQVTCTDGITVETPKGNLE
jgi:aerobic-type carbon monoxide dehydrogenase small subunit (CoxS/CutS family)